MKKCIKIYRNFYVNLDKITAFDFPKDLQIFIYTGDDSPFSVSYTDHFPDGFTSDMFSFYVKIQEIHRIKREICEYFEIDEPKSDLPQQSNVSTDLDVSSF